MTPATPRPEFDVEAARRTLDRYGIMTGWMSVSALTEIDRLRAENEKMRAVVEAAREIEDYSECMEYDGPAAEMNVAIAFDVLREALTALTPEAPDA